MKTQKRIFLVIKPGLSANNEIVKFLSEHFCVTDVIEEADEIVALGGDGTLLHGGRNFYQHNKPIIGWHYGAGPRSVGFTMHKPDKKLLDEYIRGEVNYISIRMLEIDLYNHSGECFRKEYAFGDCYFKAASYMEDDDDKACFLKVSINGMVWDEQLSGDGAIVATPFGATAYSGSANGVVPFLGMNGMVLTANNPMLNTPWKSVLLEQNEEVTLEALEFDIRPVKFMVDGRRIREVAKAVIRQSKRTVTMMFTKSHDYREKVLNLLFHRKCN